MTDHVERDEATHRPVAVLEGRAGTALRQWLQENKQRISIISRDRICSKTFGQVKKCLKKTLTI
ncbi:hypothetical protein [Desulfosporosinus youngiae]|nr:hypothetical protein [Desulfosporosinus youngiae]